ncbi:cupin domain-containing protein [Trinickia acidisoli]|uniref:cupin domain-containing protein n=1 Tax=Trinickia acidisoli TaxID=2767482 RepID=UPI001A8E69CB|nr:cupin domain-containing protein [Trinickia acidisoli]
MNDHSEAAARQGVGRIVNLREKLGLVADPWIPRVVAQMNDYQFKVVKVRGDFVWHSHADTDETFFVVEGEVRIDMRDGPVHLHAGDLFVVPRGVEHKPFAEHEASLMLIEPCGVLNTGDARGERTQPNDVWI